MEDGEIMTTHKDGKTGPETVVVQEATDEVVEPRKPFVRVLPIGVFVEFQTESGPYTVRPEQLIEILVNTFGNTVVSVMSREHPLRTPTLHKYEDVMRLLGNLPNPEKKKD